MVPDDDMITQFQSIDGERVSVRFDLKKLKNTENLKYIR